MDHEAEAGALDPEPHGVLVGLAVHDAVPVGVRLVRPPEPGEEADVGGADRDRGHRPVVNSHVVVPEQLQHVLRQPAVDIHLPDQVRGEGERAGRVDELGQLQRAGDGDGPQVIDVVDLSDDVVHPLTQIEGHEGRGLPHRQLELARLAGFGIDLDDLEVEAGVAEAVEAVGAGEVAAHRAVGQDVEGVAEGGGEIVDEGDLQGTAEGGQAFDVDLVVAGARLDPADLYFKDAGRVLGEGAQVNNAGGVSRAHYPVIDDFTGDRAAALESACARNDQRFPGIWRGGETI